MQHKSRNLKGKAEVVNIHFQPKDFFFFPLVSQRTIRKIVLFFPVRVIAICTVIKINRNSKLEVVNIHFQPEDFFFSPLVSQRTIRKIVLLFPVRALAICTVIKKNRNSKLEAGAMEPQGFFFIYFHYLFSRPMNRQNTINMQ